MERLLFSSVLLVVCVLTVPASAQEADDAQTRARQAFELGRRAYDDERYEDSIRYYEEAHRLSSLPELLYNIGAANEHLGRREAAVEHFTRFLEALPDAQNRAEVEARIRVLRAALEAESQPDDVTVPESTPEGAYAERNGADPGPAPQGDAGPHVAGIATLIAGGVLLANFGVFAVLSQVENDDLASTCGTSCREEDVQTLNAYNIVADFSWIAGAAVGLTGVILLVALPADSGAGEAVAVAPWVTPNGAGLMAVGSF